MLSFILRRMRPCDGEITHRIRVPTTRLKNLFYSKFILNLKSSKVEHVIAVEEQSCILRIRPAEGVSKHSSLSDCSVQRYL